MEKHVRRPCSTGTWPTSTRPRAVMRAAGRSSCCTETRRRATCGATSSPTLEVLGRCIAPDLIGMGDSDKLGESGPAPLHVRRAPPFPRRLPARRWASTAAGRHRAGGPRLGFGARASTGPAVTRDAVDGIAYMEAIVAPVTWADWPDEARGIFQAFRSQKGEELILERNFFVEKILPALGADTSVRRGDGRVPPPVRAARARAGARR